MRSLEREALPLMIKAFFKRLSPRFQMFSGAHELRKGTAIAQASEYRQLKAMVAENSPGNIACNGFKVYSQNDEDGVIEEIFRRIGGNRSFLEIGVQTGIECNSLYLLLKGWRGSWIEGSASSVESIGRELGGTSFPPRFQAISSFVTRGNIVELYDRARRFAEVEEIDFFSLDIDGNDLHVLADLLSAGARPRIVCVEYHGKFPPPLSLTIRYADDYVWDETDYMGSSLQAFADLFASCNYRLITCNIPGINAFFAREDVAEHFPTLTVEQLYQPYRPYLSPFPPAQPPTLRYLRDLLNRAA
jgi:hypothetical protein